MPTAGTPTRFGRPGPGSYDVPWDRSYDNDRAYERGYEHGFRDRDLAERWDEERFFDARDYFRR